MLAGRPVPLLNEVDKMPIGNRTVYRAMQESPGGGPMIGPTARTLGVRPGVDIPVVAGRVSPGTGGLSVAPHSVMNLPDHRRPPALGGTGKDPVWGFDLDSLGSDLTFRQDKVHHGLFEPAREMSIDELQAAIAAMAPGWTKL
jgi:hypothetical protein